MALTCGFYNSLSGDRKYDAIQIGEIFDGIIGDGIYESIGDWFAVKATTGMNITVGTGRAWFNHTWTKNDAPLPLTVSPANAVLDRIDTVVLEVNADLDVRNNTIKIISGTPSNEPLPPTLIKANDVYQYPLADIYLAADVTAITQANITNRIGTSDTPFVVGLLEVKDVEVLVAQWENQFDQWMNVEKNDFLLWYARIRDQLSEDAAGHLQLEIDAINDNADKYDSKSTYNVDAYAIYNDVLYRCIIAIEEPEVFDSTKWEPINLEKLDTPAFDSYDDSTVFAGGNLGGQAAYEWIGTSTLESRNPLPVLFRKISRMFKNIRLIAKLIGTTDISSIGNGTISGALNTLNTGKASQTALNSEINTRTTQDQALSTAITNEVNARSQLASTVASRTILQSTPLNSGWNVTSSNNTLFRVGYSRLLYLDFITDKIFYDGQEYDLCGIDPIDLPAGNYLYTESINGHGFTLVFIQASNGYILRVHMHGTMPANTHSALSIPYLSGTST